MLEDIKGDKCYEVLDYDNYVLLYFGASWCGPCQQVLPKMRELSEKYDSDKIKFYKVDIDNEENNRICDSCQIKVVPAFLLFNGRNFIDRTKGNNIPGVVNMINSRLFPPVNFQVLNENSQLNPPPPNNSQQKMFDYQQSPSVPPQQRTPDFQQQTYELQNSKKDPYAENRKIFNKEKLFL